MGGEGGGGPGLYKAGADGALCRGLLSRYLRLPPGPQCGRCRRPVYLRVSWHRGGDGRRRAQHWWCRRG